MRPGDNRWRERVYQGRRSTGPEGEQSQSALREVIVTRTDEAGITRPLKHRNRHSPDGFEWGYGGSGPSDLARSLIYDHLGIEEVEPDEYHMAYDADSRQKWAERIYLDFKNDVIANLPRWGPWVLTTSDIDNWLRRNEARGACPACGGPHTVHETNPWAHSISCALKPAVRTQL